MIARDDHGGQKEAVLSSPGYHQLTLMVLLLLDVSMVHAGEQGMAHALMDPCATGSTLGVVVAVFPLGNTRFEDDWVHQTVGRICFHGHHAIKVVEE